jgi:hypothetical protein
MKAKHAAYSLYRKKNKRGAFVWYARYTGTRTGCVIRRSGQPGLPLPERKDGGRRRTRRRGPCWTRRGADNSGLLMRPLTGTRGIRIFRNGRNCKTRK